MHSHVLLYKVHSILLLALTVNLLQLLDVVQYPAVVDDQQRKDNEIVSGYYCGVGDDKLFQVHSVHIGWN